LKISDAYFYTRKHTIALCAPLKTEDYLIQSSVFASPVKWNLAHTTWFFEEFILKNYYENYKEFAPGFNFLFNSYYNNAGERVARTDRGNLSRPGVEEVLAYRAYVDEKMLQFLATPLSPEVSDLVTLGINHEQQHQELLLTDLKYNLAQNPLFPLYDLDFKLVNGENDSSGFVSIEEGVYEIGHEGKGFCFDNELGRHKVYLHPFEISKTLVTNEEFIEFINDDGYSDFNLWLDEGWSWLQNKGIKAPLYWHKREGDWFYFTLGGLQKVNPKAILSHISFYEAAAFAEWKNMRLPTEFEWETASGKLPWGKRWEWTNSAYLPYPNFQKASGAIGEYNGKFMINQMVLRGASVATPENHSRKTYRNFFHPDERWQFTGIRLVKRTYGNI